MRKVWRVVPTLLLVALPPRSPGEDSGAPRTSLEELTRETQERLRQWDAEDEQEEKLAGRYWFLQIIELALSLAVLRGGHVGSFHAVSYSGPGGLTIQTQAPRAVSSVGLSSKKTE